MSGEIRKQDDPLLRAVLDSAQLDEPPDGAEEAMLAALGLGATAAVLGAASAAKLGASQAPLTTGVSALAKAAPLAAKLLGVLSVVGLGAVAWTQQSHRSDVPPARESERPVAKRMQSASSGEAPVAAVPLAPMPPALALPRIAEPAAPRGTSSVAPALSREPAAFAPAAPAPTGESLEVETRLLGAARKALAAGDKPAAREYLRRYEREVTAGSLQREADILWNRAR